MAKGSRERIGGAMLFREGKGGIVAPNWQCQFGIDLKGGECGRMRYVHIP